MTISKFQNASQRSLLAKIQRRSQTCLARCLDHNLMQPWQSILWSITLRNRLSHVECGMHTSLSISSFVCVCVCSCLVVVARFVSWFGSGGLLPAFVCETARPSCCRGWCSPVVRSLLWKRCGMLLRSPLADSWCVLICMSFVGSCTFFARGPSSSECF